MKYQPIPKPADEILYLTLLKTMSEYDDILKFAIGLAEKASKMIKDGRVDMWKKSGSVTSKLSSVDVSVFFNHSPSETSNWLHREIVRAESSW